MFCSGKTMGDVYAFDECADRHQNGVISRPPSFRAAKKGRGPEVHEALQRINEWRSPDSRLFDCGTMAEYRRRPHDDDDDSSDDSVFEYCDDLPCDYLKTDADRSRSIRQIKQDLRRSINQVLQKESIISSKKKSHLYDAVNTQLQNNSGPSSKFRLDDEALNLLFKSKSVNKVLSSADKKHIRRSRRKNATPKQQQQQPSPLNYPQTPSLNYDAQTSATPDQRLFNETSITAGNGLNSRLPIMETKKSTLSIHTQQKDDLHKLANNVASFKSLKSPTAVGVKTSKRSHKKTTEAHSNGDVMCNNVKKNTITKHNSNPGFLTADHATSGDIEYFFNEDDIAELDVCSNSLAYESSEDIGINGKLIGSTSHTQRIVNPDAILAPPQENNLDLSPLLNDLFTDYNPTREGAEEVERATAYFAKSLDSLFDEKILTETLASFSDFVNIPPVKSESVAELSSLPS